MLKSNLDKVSVTKILEDGEMSRKVKKVDLQKMKMFANNNQSSANWDSDRHETEFGDFINTVYTSPQAAFSNDFGEESNQPMIITQYIKRESKADSQQQGSIGNSRAIRGKFKTLSPHTFNIGTQIDKFNEENRTNVIPVHLQPTIIITNDDRRQLEGTQN